jgi:hypothetical protein
MDSAELAVQEEEKRIENMSHGTSCCFVDDFGRRCGAKPADFRISWRDDSGKEDTVWYCLPHFKEMQTADNMLPLLSAHIAAMPFDDECEL